MRWSNRWTLLRSKLQATESACLPPAERSGDAMDRRKVRTPIVRSTMLSLARPRQVGLPVSNFKMHLLSKSTCLTDHLTGEVKVARTYRVVNKMSMGRFEWFLGSERLCTVSNESRLVVFGRC